MLVCTRPTFSYQVVFSGGHVTLAMQMEVRKFWGQQKCLWEVNKIICQNLVEASSFSFRNGQDLSSLTKTQNTFGWWQCWSDCTIISSEWKRELWASTTLSRIELNFTFYIRVSQYLPLFPQCHLCPRSSGFKSPWHQCCWSLLFSSISHLSCEH